MPAFDASLNQSITIYPKSSRDFYGKPSFGTGVAVPCRFDNKRQIKLMINQEETVTDAWAMVDPTTVVNDSDKVLAPDGNNYRIIMINQVPDRYGDTHHIELGLQIWRI